MSGSEPFDKNHESSAFNRAAYDPLCRPRGQCSSQRIHKTEDLGIHEIAGAAAHGIRETQTVTDENDDKEVVITDEYWYSQDLRINLMIKHSDPRKGTTTMTVAQVTRTEPDPAFFEIAEGYAHFGAQAGTEKANDDITRAHAR